MRFGSVYFFAEEQIDFALWYTLIRIIRKDKPDCHFTLIYSLRDRSKKYDISFYLSLFDEVYKVDHVSYWKNGIWRKGLTMRTFLYALRKNFRAAYGVMRQLKNINFSPGSIAFANNGISLNHALFLKRVKSIRGIKSVLFLSPDQVLQESNLKDYVHHISRSAYLNLHLYFFGTAPLDVYWVKTPYNVKTNYREFHFRRNPADYVLNMSYPLRHKDQGEDHFLLPLIKSNKEFIKKNISTTVFIGQPHYWIEGISKLAQEKFYLRLNEIIFFIKEKNSGQRLVYKRHPGEIEEKFEKIDTSGFEIEFSMSSEALFFNDSSITKVYAFSSTSVQVAVSLGIPSYYLYDLFDAEDLGVPKTIQRHWRNRWCSEVHSEMNIKSIDHWMNGKNDYTPINRSEEILETTEKMLSLVGFH
jgi:DNA-binding cell septation regulator SpoVG